MVVAYASRSLCPRVISLRIPFEAACHEQATLQSWPTVTSLFRLRLPHVDARIHTRPVMERSHGDIEPTASRLSRQHLAFVGRRVHRDCALLRFLPASAAKCGSSARCRAVYSDVPRSHADISSTMFWRSRSYSARRGTFTPKYRVQRVLTPTVVLGPSWVGAHNGTERTVVSRPPSVAMWVLTVVLRPSWDVHTEIPSSPCVDSHGGTWPIVGRST